MFGPSFEPSSVWFQSPSFGARLLCTRQMLSKWKYSQDTCSVQLLSRVRLCDPMNHSTPGLPVYHHLPEFTQTHNHRVGDAIQPSHPLSSLSPPAPNPFPASESFPISQLFAWGAQSTRVSALASFLPKKSQGWSPSEWTGWRDSQESSPAPQFKSINSSVLSLLNSPTLTSIHDHRKNHSLD